MAAVKVLSRRYQEDRRKHGDLVIVRAAVSVGNTRGDGGVLY
jgi:hypothetical protein